MEAFQRADGMWSFRRLAMLGVVQDARAYPTSQAAVEAARAEYPNETISIVTPPSPEQDMNASPAPERDTEGDVFKPADDTPAVLPKRAGPAPK
ncbi:hypothetical protein [Achromobacter marplatensis]